MLFLLFGNLRKMSAGKRSRRSCRKAADEAEAGCEQPAEVLMKESVCEALCCLDAAC